MEEINLYLHHISVVPHGNSFMIVFVASDINFAEALTIQLGTMVKVKLIDIGANEQVILDIMIDNNRVCHYNTGQTIQSYPPFVHLINDNVTHWIVGYMKNEIGHLFLPPKNLIV